MAKVFLNLPLPALNGPGASVNVSSMGSPKTITCVGSFAGAVVLIEASVDGGVTWAPVVQFNNRSPDSAIVENAVQFMRTNVSGARVAVPANVDVAGSTDVTAFVAVPLPVGTGAGAPVDISLLGELLTFVVGGVFPNTGIQMQISEDGTDWATIGQFSGAGGSLTKVITTRYVRTFVTGKGPGTATVGVGTATQDATAGSQSQFKPGRTLFVAKSWPADLDPLVFFTSIQAAINQAGTMAPSFNSPMLVQVYPGVYTESAPAPLTLLANVSLAAVASGDALVQLNTDISWLPTGNTLDAMVFDGFVIGGGFNFTINTTGKTGNQVLFYSHETQFRANTWTGRGNGLEEFIIYDANFLSQLTNTFNNITFTGSGIGVELVGCRLRGTQFQGNTTARIEGGTVASGAVTTIALTDTANVRMAGISNLALVTVASGCTLTASGGCDFNNTLTVAAGGVADIRGSTIDPANLPAAGGLINRDTWNGSTGATPAGATVVALSPPFIDANYNVQLQLTAGTGDAGAVVGAKTNAGFTVTVPAGVGCVWDYSVIHN